jgi:hypothetical protein
MTLLAPAALLALATTGQGALLSTLIAGGSVSAGNATYSNFALLGGSSPAASLINVTANTSAGGASVITFSLTSGTWTTPADSSRISFTATFTTPISAVGLDFVATGSPTGIASVGETATYQFNGGPIDTPLQVLTDGAGAMADSFSMVAPLAHETTSLSIIKSIDIASSGGAASITSVSNSYIPTPEPTSLVLMGLGVPVLLRRRKH